MTTYSRPPTLSKTLLRLGRIRSIESSISTGLSAFYRAQECIVRSKEEPEHVKHDLQHFQEFCVHFVKIVSAEGEDFSSIEEWLLEESNGERASRINSFLAIYSLFPEKSDREKWRDEFETLGEMTREVRQGLCERQKIDEVLERLHKLRSELKHRLEAEKKSSEKVLSGRAPLT
jgi:hypothetical protein